jgi:hypothetical protein
MAAAALRQIPVAATASGTPATSRHPMINAARETSPTNPKKKLSANVKIFWKHKRRTKEKGMPQHPLE